MFRRRKLRDSPVKRFRGAHAQGPGADGSITLNENGGGSAAPDPAVLSTQELPPRSSAAAAELPESSNGTFSSQAVVEPLPNKPRFWGQKNVKELTQAFLLVGAAAGAVFLLTSLMTALLFHERGVRYVFLASSASPPSSATTPSPPPLSACADVAACVCLSVLFVSAVYVVSGILLVVRFKMGHSFVDKGQRRTTFAEENEEEEDEVRSDVQAFCEEGLLSLEGWRHLLNAVARARDDVGVIRARICAVFCVCVVAGWVTLNLAYVRINIAEDGHEETNINATLARSFFSSSATSSSSGRFAATLAEVFGCGLGFNARVLLPVYQMLFFYLGFLAEQHWYCLVRSRFQDYAYQRGSQSVDERISLVLRELVVGPLFEEFVFRACFLRILMAAGLSRLFLTLVAPLFFGLAHVHFVLTRGVPATLLQVLFYNITIALNFDCDVCFVCRHIIVMLEYVIVLKKDFFCVSTVRIKIFFQKKKKPRSVTRGFSGR